MAFPTTYADLRTRIVAKARLDATADATKVNDAINVAYAELVVETEWLSGYTSTTYGSLTAGTTTGSVQVSAIASGAVARFKRITTTSGGVTTRSLPYITQEEMLERRASNTDVASPATAYTLFGYNDLVIDPTPASGDSVNAYYVKLPTALSSDGDVPILGEPYGSRAIEYKALVQMGEFKGDPLLGDWQAKAEYWQGKLLTHLGRRRTSQPGSFMPDPAVNYPPHDPAVIWAAWP